MTDIATTGSDVLLGSSGDDFIDGLAGDDEILGLEGNDTLLGGDGNDTLDGGSGNDVLDGGSGFNTVYGGEGDDVITIRSRTVLGLDSDVAYGGSGNDTFFISGYDGRGVWDYANASGGSGSDIFNLSSAVGFFEGGDGNGVFSGTSSDGTISGGAGDDSVSLTLLGGYFSFYSSGPTFDDGNDFIRLSGVAINVSIESYNGNNTVDLSDLQLAYPGVNVFLGDGNDTVTGSSSNDSISAGAGANIVDGGDGNDTIYAGEGNDTLSGGNGDDSISGGGGNDTLSGGNGNDTISGGSGANTITGGAGKDSFVGISDGDLITDYQSGERIILGQSLTPGQVRLVAASNGTDTELQLDGDNNGTFETTLTLSGTISGRFILSSEGGLNNNIIRVFPLSASIATTGSDVLLGSSGDDFIDGLAGDDEILGLEGNDTLLGGDGNDTLDGGSGNDVLDGGSGFNTVYGGEGDDVITIRSRTVLGLDSDVAYGGSGNDTFFISGYDGRGVRDYANASGGSGSDIFNLSSAVGFFEGGDGNDVFSGTFSDGTISGGAGDDSVSLTLLGGYFSFYSSGPTFDDGNDFIRLSGVAINVSIESYNGNNTVDLSDLQLAYPGVNVFLGDGNDTVTGSSSNDSISAGAGANIVDGGDGNDTIYAGEGNDTLSGGNGDDSISGGGGNDTLSGGNGNDTISGGSGANTITGGAGKDSFVGISDGDLITDYQSGERIILGQSLTPGQVRLVAASNGTDTELQLDGDNNGTFETTLTLSGTISGRLILTSNGDVENSVIRIFGPPTFVEGSTTTVSAVENTATATVVVATTGNEQATVTYSIIGGADAPAFSIDSNTGNLSFLNAPDFEAPADFDRNNTYEVVVQASDGDLVSSQTIIVVVTPLNEAPVITSNSGGASSAISVSEDTTVVTTVTATDPDAGTKLGYSISGGADAAKFKIDSLSGALSFIAAPDFEAPGDANSDNVYNLIVQASDGVLIDVQDIAVTVTNQSPETVTGTNAIDTFRATAERELFNGLLGTDTVSYELATLGVVANLLAPAGNTGFAAGDTYTSIENLTGSAFADTLTGDTSANVLDGGAGTDTMAGGLGNDTYVIDVVTDVVTEAANAGTDLVQVAVAAANGTYTLAANVENGTLTNAVAFNLTGNGFNNVLTGNAVANVLNGGAGVDTMAGGLGDDTYVIDVLTDVVTEAANAGTDLVQVAVATAGGTHTLAANVENGTLTNTVAFTLTGNALNNTLIGNAAANVLNGLDGNDILDGRAGTDTMVGGLGDDTYVIDVLTDVVTEAANGGRDLVQVVVAAANGTYTLAANVEDATLANAVAFNLTGNALNNLLTGNAAANILNGGAGVDTMTGGLGNDTYVIDVLTDVVTEDINAGTDLVQVAVAAAGGTYTLAANVENATLTNTVAFNLTGNALANSLTGNAAANVLDGGAGVDTMAGGAGNDTYVIDVLTDVVTEAANAGTDLVRVAVATAGGTYTLAANVENATLTNTVAFNLTGNALNNTLTGNSFNNFLNGGAGTDAMAGGLGDDTYVIDVLTDVVTEAANGGTDLVQVAVTAAGGTHTLAANVENGTLTNAVAFNLTGNALANTLTGNASANVLNGQDGDDILNGLAGNDSIFGGLGNDSLTGGLGADIFVFNTAPNAATNVDRITDFSVVDDTIQLENAIFTALGLTTGTNAAAFVVGAAAADASDRIVYNSATGALLYDSNGNGAGGSVQIANLAAGLALTNSDFVII